MSKFEICYLAAMGALIALSLLSLILVPLRGGRNVKKAFFAISLLTLVLCLFEAISFMTEIDFYPSIRLYELRDKWYITLMALALTILSASELPLMLRSLIAKKKPKSAEQSVELVNTEYPLPENERTAGVVVHTDYKIVKEDK